MAHMILIIAFTVMKRFYMAGFFFNSGDLVNIYSEAPRQEKDEVYKVLNRLYPTETTRLEPLRK